LEDERRYREELEAKLRDCENHREEERRKQEEDEKKRQHDGGDGLDRKLDNILEAVGGAQSSIASLNGRIDKLESAVINRPLSTAVATSRLPPSINTFCLPPGFNLLRYILPREPVVPTVHPFRESNGATDAFIPRRQRPSSRGFGDAAAAPRHVDEGRLDEGLDAGFVNGDFVDDGAFAIGGETVAVGDAADAVDGDAGDDAPTQGILERMEENPDQSLGDILKQVAADKAKEKADLIFDAAREKVKKQEDLLLEKVKETEERIVDQQMQIIRDNVETFAKETVDEPEQIDEDEDDKVDEDNGGGGDGVGNDGGDDGVGDGGNGNGNGTGAEPKRNHPSEIEDEPSTQKTKYGSSASQKISAKKGFSNSETSPSKDNGYPHDIPETDGFDDEVSLQAVDSISCKKKRSERKSKTLTNPDHNSKA